MSHNWQLRELRATRAVPPGRASGGERRTVYEWSLQQFEELLVAAAETGYSSRPLPLFYALSQAGRAIVAARGEQGIVQGHGLREHPYGAVGGPEDLLQRRIDPRPKKDGTDAFGAVAKATGSGTLTGSVKLGAVWAATPGLHRLPGDSWDPSWRLALGAREETTWDFPTYTAVRLSSFSGNPLVDGFDQDRYPTLPGNARIRLEELETLDRGNWMATAVWQEGGTLESVAPEVDGEGSRYLIPLLPGENELLSPLMLWWLLLYGLSIFARYHPGLWGSALTVSSSTRAVPVESVLDLAIDVLPGLVYSAVTEAD